MSGTARLPTAGDQIQNSVSQYWLPIVIAAVIIAVAAFISLRQWRDGS